MLHVRSTVRPCAEGERVVEELKTERHGTAGRRTIPLPADLVAILRREQRDQATRRLSPYVIADERGAHQRRQWLRHRAVESPRRPACARSAPTATATASPRCFVHGGMALTQLAKLLGHTNLDMLNRTYGHAMVDVPDRGPFLGAPVAVAG